MKATRKKKTSFLSLSLSLVSLFHFAHPDVDAQDRHVPRVPQLLHQRVVLVGRRLHGQRLGLVPGPDEPGPPRPKHAEARRLELLYHLRKGAEREVDLALELARELGGTVVVVVRPELVEVEEVVPRAAAVVADRRRRGLGVAGVFDHGRERLVAAAARNVLQGFVEVVDVGRDVLAVVEGDGAVGDGRLERVLGVGERDDGEGRRGGGGGGSCCRGGSRRGENTDDGDDERDE